jgi:hypothetical protein
VTVELQLKINSDPKLKMFIRQYPNWYKLLNRNPNLFKEFVNDMKEKYKITTADKLNKTFDSISMFQTFLEVLK